MDPWQQHGRDAVTGEVTDVERMRQALEALALRGIHADTALTLDGQLGDGSHY